MTMEKLLGRSSQIVWGTWPCCSTLEVKSTFLMVSKDQANSRTDSLTTGTNMSCFMVPSPMEMFKLDSTVEELPAVFSPVVNLKRSVVVPPVVCS